MALNNLNLNYLFNNYIYKDGNLYRIMRFKLPCDPYIPYNVVNNSGYHSVSAGDKRVGLHIAIWAYHHNKWPEDEIDHIDRDKLNNRIENLREADRSLNAINTKISTRNSSGIRNLSYHKGSDNWRLDININGKNRTFYEKDKNKAIRLCKIMNWHYKPERYNREVFIERASN